jgi:myosin V
MNMFCSPLCAQDHSNTRLQDVLDLIEKKPLGVLDSLDETCRFPQATGATFAEKLYGNPEIMNHKRFTKPKKSQMAFIIDHYAGNVEYQVHHFLDKNKDFVVKEHQDLLAGSGLGLISGALVATMPCSHLSCTLCSLS